MRCFGLNFRWLCRRLNPQLDGGVVLLENPSFTTSLVLDAPRVAAPTYLYRISGSNSCHTESQLLCSLHFLV